MTVNRLFTVAFFYRLTYWWSNIVVLRESIMEACNVEPADTDAAATSGSDNSFADRAKQYHMRRQRNTRQGSTSEILGFKTFNNDWQDCNTYVVALLKVETWIHGRILECVWWQVNNHVRSRVQGSGF